MALAVRRHDVPRLRARDDAELDAEAPDLVHIATPDPIGITGLLAARLLGLPVVGELRDAYDHPAHGQPVERRARLAAYRLDLRPELEAI